MVERNGRRYRLRTITARNVHEGDLVPFIDGTGPVGTISEMSIGTVWLADSVPWSYRGRGRHFVPEWRRRQIYAQDWRGSVRSWALPTGPMLFAHTDQVQIWREVR
jgi:hypothetical protein